MIDTKELRRLALDGYLCAVQEVIDRLEAAENDAAHQKALAESALRVAEGWERKCGELRSSMKFRTSLIGRTEAERDELRAKITEMEKQEPVALVESWANGSYSRNYRLRWLCDVNEGAKLYALPGAKGEIK